MRKFILLLLFFFLFSSTIHGFYYSVLEDAERKQINKLLPEGYGFAFCEKEDFNGDGEDEYWVIANKTIDDLDYTKLFVYSKVDKSFKLIWESNEILGTFRRATMDVIDVNGNKYLYIETVNRILRKYQLWIHEWNGKSTYLINEPMYSDRPISAIYNTRGVFENLSLQEFVFVIYDKTEDSTKSKGYIIRNNKLVLGDEIFEKNEPEPIYPSLEELFPEIALAVQNKYPGYKLEDHWNLDQRSNLVKIKSEQGHELWLVIETTMKEGEIEQATIWYSLDEKYSTFFYPHKNADVNNDGYIEISLYYSESLDNDWVYILSLKPEGVSLVSPVDDKGNSVILKFNRSNYIAFEDINGDGFLDLKTSPGYNTIKHWLWNPDIEKFEFDKIVYY